METPSARAPAAQPLEDEAHRGGSHGLARYVLAALLVRSADSGATVGVVLLALAVRGHPGGGAAAGGLLAAALSAPHLFGPWLARRLDRAHEGLRLLAGAFVLYAVALAGTAVAVGRAPLAVALCTTAVAGSCGPLLTGGLSSRLAALAGGGEHAQRRAQGWDSTTYGLGGTLGPAAVAGTAALADPRAALLALCGAATTAALLTATLPSARSDGPRPKPATAANPGATPTVRQGVGILVRHGPLRRVTVLTLMSALELGALPVIAMTHGPQLAHRPSAGAVLTTVMGLGNLAGSLLVTAVPLRGDAEVWALRLFAVLAAVTALTACAPGYATALAGFALVGVANSFSFTATLAARSAYAPPAARAQVFVTSAGLKVAVASVGTAAAGAASGLGGRLILLAAAACTAAAVCAALADRLRAARRAADAHGV
ncbi:MFS transporter [Actinacidiphila acidipaludis]|uniref:MFS transporter n=1 Tax=Actinacidiphila acidipaludis TaxID=2873382 RepID=A0ABS7QDF1_9ACTN|nr:MFS transporter [Streptomyces acidipaludis]MBY8881157.1 MFS transporter [Streptomyces acidipaludis]